MKQLKHPRHLGYWLRRLTRARRAAETAAPLSDQRIVWMLDNIALLDRARGR